MVGIVMVAAAAADLKQIDNEMQAILAELLMSCPQQAVQPELTRLSFPLPADDTVINNPPVGSLQPHILPQQQLIQTPGLLSSLALICHKTLQTATSISFFKITCVKKWIEVVINE